ncbi:MAG: transposase [Ichthyobacteriaceae bacterium]|nr:transposase [Ichthyobacteriaceae bacterium]
MKTVSGVGFITLFLQHILPPRFVKIRNYGFLSSRKKTERLTVFMEYFHKPKYKETQRILVFDVIKEVYNIDIRLCAKCKSGNC